jgi:hypothetical protein
MFAPVGGFYKQRSRHYGFYFMLLNLPSSFDGVLYDAAHQAQLA